MLYLFRMNCSELFENLQKHFQACFLPRVRIITEKTQETDIIEIEGGCLTTYGSNNNADHNVQPYEGQSLADGEWMSRDNKERIVDGKRL